MSDISLDDKKFASVAHTGYLGTIAVDNEVGRFLDKIGIPSGYGVAGLRINMGNIQDLTELRNCPVDIVLHKMGESNWEYSTVTRSVNLQELLSASINIEIRLATQSNFRRDRIDWDSLDELNEDV